MFATSNSSPAPLNWVKSLLRRQGTPDLFAERRAARREKISFKVEIDGPDGVVPANGVDIHGQGAMVISKQAWANGTILFVQLKDFRLGGYADVRHCTLRKGGNYAIGLRFRGPLAAQVGDWRVQRVCSSADAWTRTDDCQAPGGDLFKVA